MKRSLKKSSSSHSQRKIQGSILNFLKKQRPEELLRSNDGLTQGKLDQFMKSKNSVECNASSTCMKRTQKEEPKCNTKRPKLTSTCPRSRNKMNSELAIKKPVNVLPECIDIADDSGSEEFYTAPNTQGSSSPEETFTEATSGTDKLPANENDWFIPNSPVLLIKPSSRNNKDESIQDHMSSESSVQAKGDVSLQYVKSMQKAEQSMNDNILTYSQTNDEGNVGCLQPLSSSNTETKDGVKEAQRLSTEVGMEMHDPSSKAVELCDDAVLNEFLLCDSYVEDFMSHNLLPKAVENERHNVLGVREELSEHGYLMKYVELKNEKTRRKLKIILEDTWADSNIEEGDVVNLVKDDDVAFSDELPVNAQANLLVLHPDRLISGTTVSNSHGCLRRAVLSERFKNTETADAENISNVMLVGTLVHEIFQTALKLKKSTSYEELSRISREVICGRRYLADIVAVNSTQDIILKEVEVFLPRIKSWISEYCRSRTTSGCGMINMKHNSTKSKQLPREILKYAANVAMTEVVDIEENIWSPRYGMKGKIDVTGKFQVRKKDTHEEFSTIVPIEVKTGRDSHSMEHHIQVAIYSMFCDERRNKNISSITSIPAGFLLYLKTGTTACMPLKRVDKMGILSLRNQIADYLTKDVKVILQEDKKVYHAASFPPPITNTRICQRCSQLRNCSLIQRSIDKEASSVQPTLELDKFMNQHTSHLTEDDLAYFEHWMTCVLLECRESTRQDKKLRMWLDSPKSRCHEGRCVTGLCLAGAAVAVSWNGRFLQTFKRSSDNEINKATFEVGEIVLISGTEPEFIAMATGTIHKTTEHFITVEMNRDLNKYEKNMVYSIDRHVWMSQISVQSSLSNLSILMDNNEQCNRLRNLIIGHREPTFRKSLDFLQSSSKNSVASMLRGLNRTQRQAIKRVLLSNDYTLVVGMPGSGKTTTIVAMIRILLFCGLRVLVTSYTHSAVDNLLSKLIKYKVNFLRLGSSSRIHPSVQPFSENFLSRDFKNTNQLKDLYESARVVGCTCLAVTSHVFFAVPGQPRPNFDVCIVDEASQIAQPACLAPLVHANRFVLVGDHQQLPPLVVSPEAKSMGADESLFWRLSTHLPALCELTLQYRMNSKIMAVSNHVTYEGRLECAHPSVAVATVTLDGFNRVRNEIETSGDDWLIKALDPKFPVVFLDTSKVQFEEVQLIENKMEAEIVTRVTDFFIKAGCHGDHIGIIAPFRKQVQLLEEEISKVSSDVEVNTVDKYQGRDKSVILLSFVKSAKGEVEEKKGELLSDWRRLNVAITRAKHKLIMVGCSRTLLQYEPCKKLVNYLIDKDFMSSL